MANINAVEVAISLVLVVSIIATAHYLQQIRDVLRSMHETQKKVAVKLGVPRG